MTPQFALYGLCLATDLPLKAPPADPARAPDLTILRGEDLSADYPPPSGEVWAAADFGNGVSVRLAKTNTGWSLLYPSTAEVSFTSDLRTGTIHGAPGKADILPLLLGSSVPTWWLNLRGEPVLHASAVAMGDRAVAFMGASGMGKSTLATLLCARGAQLITDDALRLVREGDDFRCHYGPGELRLRPAAAALAGQFAPEQADFSADGRTTLRLAAQTGELPRLAAIFIPRPSREVKEPCVERLSLVQASFHLNGFTRVIGWQVDGPLRRQFEWFGELTRHVPVAKLTVPWGPPFAPELAARIWDSLPPGES